MALPRVGTPILSGQQYASPEDGVKHRSVSMTKPRVRALEVTQSRHRVARQRDRVRRQDRRSSRDGRRVGLARFMLDALRSEALERLRPTRLPSSAAPLSDGCGEVRVEVAGKRFGELPRDGHRLLADVASIDRWTEEPEGAVIGSEAAEKHDRRERDTRTRATAV